MVDWSYPGLPDFARSRLEEAGFTPESVARARPSELVRRAGLRADLARRLVAHYRGEAPGAAPFTFRSAGVGGRGGPAREGETASGGGSAEDSTPLSAGAPGSDGREWVRVWDLGARAASGGALWRWRGKVVFRLSLLRPP